MSKLFGSAEPDPIEDLTEPIRAYRAWSTRRHWGRWGLYSVHSFERRFGPGKKHTYWRPGGLEARCFCLRHRDEQGPPCSPPPLIRRRCRAPDGSVMTLSYRSSQIGFGCGIYAMKSLHDLKNTHWFHWGDVWGEIELGGRVWPHAGGYRAQYARVVSIRGYTDQFRLNAETRTQLRDLRRRYGLDEDD